MNEDGRNEVAAAAQRTADRIEMAAWVDGLAQWDTFGTYTFRYTCRAWSAQKAFERFMAKTQPGVPVFYAIEHNPSHNEGTHVHALLATSGGLWRRGMWEKWMKQYGYARIEPVGNIGGVTGYCSKYCTKGAAWWNALNCVQGAMRAA